MHYLLLVIASTTVAAQTVFKQRFNETCRGSAYFFSTITALVAMLLFMACNRDWTYRPVLLLPSLGFALSYAAGTVFSVLAILYGPLAKTSLILSCSLLVPSAYGIVVQGILLETITIEEALSPTLLLGIVCLIITLILINQKKPGEIEEKKITTKWVLFVSLAFLGSGLCSTVQTAKQDFYGSESNNLFMIVALLMVVAILLFASLLPRTQRVLIPVTIQKGWWLATLCGIANGATNLLVMHLVAEGFPASVLFPVVSGADLLLIFLFSVLVKRERYTLPQYIGYGLGVVSLVLLNM